MEYVNTYGGKSASFDKSVKYKVENGLIIPETYLRENILKEKILDEKLLKHDVDIIIAKTPVSVLPFGWGVDMKEPSIATAKVTQFTYERPEYKRKAVPRDLELKLNASLEMIEPKLDYKGKIDFFRALSDHVVIGFGFDEDVEPFEKGYPVCVRIKRFWL